MKKRVFNKIAPTPVLEGEDAKYFIEHMDDPISERDLEIQKCLEIERKGRLFIS